MLLKTVFPFIPKQLRRRDHMSERLNRIRHLRNRIFHYEPIWYWKDLSEQHKMLYDLIGWIQSHLGDYLHRIDNFNSNYLAGYPQYNSALQLLINTSMKTK